MEEAQERSSWHSGPFQQWTFSDDDDDILTVLSD